MISAFADSYQLVVGRPYAWLAVGVIGLLSRVILAALHPVMFDEAWTIKQAAGLSLDMQLRHLDAHPPLSYAGFAAWGFLSWEIAWLRVLSLILSLLAIFPAALLARRLMGAGAVMPTSWILSVWPLPLYVGWPIRYYAILVLLGGLYLWCWAGPLGGEGAVPKRAVLCSALEILLVHTALISLPLVLVLNAYGLCRLFSYRSARLAARWTARCLLVGVIAAPQILVYRAVARHMRATIAAYPSLGLGADLLVAVKTAVLTELPYWHDTVLRPLWLLPLVVGCAVAVGLFRKGATPWPALGVLAVAGILTAVGIGSGLRQSAIYYLPLFPLVAALIGGALARVGPWVGVLLLSLVALVSLLRVTDPGYRWAWGDTATVARLVDAVPPETPVVYLDNGDRVLIDSVQFRKRRRVALLGSTAAQPALPSACVSEPVGAESSRAEASLLQAATGVYAERWTMQQWSEETLCRAHPSLYLIIPVPARGIVTKQAAEQRRRRQAANALLASATGGWAIRESAYPGSLVMELRRKPGT